MKEKDTKLANDLANKVLLFAIASNSWHGNPELSGEQGSPKGVETIDHPSQADEKIVHPHEETLELGTSREPIPAALTQWRCINPPKRGTLNSQSNEHANPVPSKSYTVGQLTETEKAYIAGFVDGEGDFTVNRRFHQGTNGRKYIGYSAYLEIGNTDKAVIDWLHDVLSITCNVYCQKQSNNRRDMYRLRMSGKQSLVVARAILPYLQVKKSIAEKFLEFPLLHRKLDRAKVESIFEEVRQINRNNGKGRGAFKYSDQLSCVRRDCTEGILTDQQNEEKVHSYEKS